VRELAARHLVEPVRFRELIQRLHAHGVRAFVQVGTGSVAGFVGDTLAGEEHLAITANTPRRTGVEQLRRVAAALWTEGLDPDFPQATPARATPPPAGAPVTLDLGAPLIRLGPAALVSLTSSAPALPTGDPLMAEFDAVLRDATSAARQVLDSVKRPATTRATKRVLSLDTMPFLADHCFYRQPPGWPSDADRYPVVPMTTLLELMADEARALVPGKQVVGFRRVRALRWLAVAPPATVSIDSTLDSDGNVDVVIDGYTRGTVVLADRYQPAPAADRTPLTGERPVAFTADRMYVDRWMFHGPAFHGVAELGPVADDGIRGVLRTPEATGALLDNAGQLMGLWIMLTTSTDRLAFPGSIDAIDLFGPHPAPGAELGCTVRVTAVGETEVAANLELHADGRVWARITSWKDRRFGTDERTWPVFQAAERNLISEEQPGGWFLARERWRDSATRELIMRRYLGEAERAEYQRQNPRGQRQWLLGRIAVKDAVRAWHGGTLFPVEITVGNDASGRPFVTGPFPEAPVVSLAHTGQLAVAAVTPGIDIEQIADRGPTFEATAFTDAERALLDRLGSDRATWVTRFWTAKEAAGKAEGTGLAGQPRRLTVEAVDGELLTVAGAHIYHVHTRVLDGHAVAWRLIEGTSDVD